MNTNQTTKPPQDLANTQRSDGWMRRLVRILRRNLWWRRPLHIFYRWYLRESCGGDHHVGPYGPDGRYIVLMTEAQYNRYTRFARDAETL
jgi:hypothetical protein